jgi:3-oxoacyl-[acyl-carrier-protein] synthase II
MTPLSRIVITGVGLTAPNANNIRDFRRALLEKKSGLQRTEIRHMGQQPAGLCDFDEARHQSKKMRKRGTRAGAISVYCAGEALQDAGIDLKERDLNRVGVYVGITEHGNVETENEIHELYQNDLKVEFWSHHHNPRTVANNAAGEVSLNLGITGPCYTIGAACAAGNMGVIEAVHMLRLGEVDLALAGGVSESPQTFGIFAAFKAQGALGDHEDVTLATRPLDISRNGIAVAEGGCLYTLERLEDALKRNAKIYGEIKGFAINSDASDFVLPNAGRQRECIVMALKRAGLEPQDIDIVNLHATGTNMGDIQECEAVSSVFSVSDSTYINFTKGHIGHAMGAAGALELAGNLMAFEDDLIHPGRNVENLDPKCALMNLVLDEPEHKPGIKNILNNSFGMLGINSSLIVQKYNSDL